MGGKSKSKIVKFTVDKALAEWTDTEGLIPRLKEGDVIQGIERDGKITPLCEFVKA